MRALTLAILAGALVVAAPGAQASCTAITKSQAVANADVVFDGIAQPGAEDAQGVLTSPVRFSVLKYRKGSGPSVLSVTSPPGEDGVKVHSGELWAVFATGATSGILQTSACHGTHLASAPEPFIPETPTPTPSPTPTHLASAPTPPEPWPWGVSTAVGAGGLLVVMGIGWAVARVVVGTR
jgi:hypothetical protein